MSWTKVGVGIADNNPSLQKSRTYLDCVANGATKRMRNRQGREVIYICAFFLSPETKSKMAIKSPIFFVNACIRASFLFWGVLSQLGLQYKPPTPCVQVLLFCSLHNA